MPTLAEHSQFVELINEMPEADNVTLFGLPANIDRGLQRNMSKRVLDQLKVLVRVMQNDIGIGRRTLTNIKLKIIIKQGRHDLSSQRFDKDKWARELMPFLQLWKKVQYIFLYWILLFKLFYFEI